MPATTTAATSTAATATARFARMVQLEESIRERKLTMAWDREALPATKMSDRQYAQHQAALVAEKAELFALVDALTPAEAAAYGAYRLTDATPPTAFRTAFAGDVELGDRIRFEVAEVERTPAGPRWEYVTIEGIATRAERFHNGNAPAMWLAVDGGEARRVGVNFHVEIAA